jgi:hypothetical protein
MIEIGVRRGPTVRPSTAFLGIALFVLLVLGANDSYARCQDGTRSTCSIDGRVGIRECIGGYWTPCIVAPEQEEPVEGTIEPDYLVLAVVYAPPGSAGGAPSSVAYGTGSNTGVTTSASSSFKQGYSVTVGAEGGILASGSVSSSFGYGRSSSSSESLDIKKSETTTIKVNGPAFDGIDHDRDLIYLWLNPLLKVRSTSTEGRWTFSDGQRAEIQHVHVGWLKDPSSMPVGVVRALRRNGVTEEHFPDILQRNPFAASNAQVIDEERYQSLHSTFPYEPPFSESDTPPTYSFSLSTAISTSSGSSVSDSYKVGVSIKGGAGFEPIFKASLKLDGSWEWTSTSGSSESTGSSETSSVTITGPSFGYEGPTLMEVFYDTIYRTFLFRPLDETPPWLRGRILGSAGEPMPFERVELDVGGNTYQTLSNARGEYRFVEPIQGRGTIRARGSQRALPDASSFDSVDLRMHN